jgi:hypothetical protein
MSRKLNSVSAIVAFTVLVLSASAAMAQRDRVRPNSDDAIVRASTLGCCKCLGGTNTLDLSTISSNNWTVNGNPVPFLTQLHPLWNINPGPAQWVSNLATGGTGNVVAGTYDYKLNFVVPACAIEQRVTLTGNYGGDDDVYVYLDNTSNLISQCTGGWCFNTPHKVLSVLPPTLVGTGGHTLIVRVNNSGPSPSGMFINAKLTGNCRT